MKEENRISASLLATLPGDNTEILIAGELAGGIVSPWEWAQAGLAFYNLGIATAAIMAAESQQNELASQLHSANALMHSVQMFMGGLSTLW